MLTSTISDFPVIALWGKTGRSEADESLAFKLPGIIAGVRSSSATAFASLNGPIVILPARSLKHDKKLMTKVLKEINTPVHLSIDVDVLSPATLQNSRSIEPGGLDWYDLTEFMDIVSTGPGIASIDITGTKSIKPGTPAAVLTAQLVLRATSLFNIHSKVTLQ